MPDPTLPDGAYFSVTNNVRADSGGQTRAVLLRNRLFTTYAGVPTTLLTFDPQPVYPVVRERLAERGELVAGMELLNIYESYRNAPISAGRGAPLAAPPGLRRVDVPHPDGTVDYTGWRRTGSTFDVVRDFRRPDGSVYLRTPGPGTHVGAVPPSPWDKWLLTDPQERVVRNWGQRTRWSQHWLRRLLGTRDRAFVISDGRFAAEKVMPFADPRFHMVHVLHNVHVGDERRWNSRVSPHYTFVLESVSTFAAVVTLTERQRADVAERYGDTDNLFSVGNPVTPAVAPDPLPDRGASRFAVVSRFEPAKRLDQCVEAFALVVAARPAARLDMFGMGQTEPAVRRLVDSLGLSANVRLHGFDPDARDTLWGATGLLLTSAHEGYPLATLEAMSRGCPVLAYDVKYGPRDQITDGVDGFLVDDGDQRALANQMIALVDDPALLARMSAAARRKAEQHDHRHFLQQWDGVLSAVVDQRDDRVLLTEVGCTVGELGTVPAERLRRVARRLPGRLGARLVRPRPGSTSGATPRRLALAAEVVVLGVRRAALRRARLSLDAVSTTSGAVTALPLRVRRTRQTFHLSSTVDLRAVFADRPVEDHSLTLRLRLVLANAAWETTVARSAALRPRYEIAFDGDDTLHLQRG